MFVQKAVQLVLPIFTFSPVKSREPADISNSTRGKEYVDQYLVRYEFIKRLHERYANQGIVIPHLIRAVNYT